MDARPIWTAGVDGGTHGVPTLANGFDGIPNTATRDCGKTRHGVEIYGV